MERVGTVLLPLLSILLPTAGLVRETLAVVVAPVLEALVMASGRTASMLQAHQILVSSVSFSGLPTIHPSNRLASTLRNMTIFPSRLLARVYQNQ